LFCLSEFSRFWIISAAMDKNNIFTTEQWWQIAEAFLESDSRDSEDPETNNQYGGQHPTDFYSFGPEREQEFRRFRMTGLSFPIQFNNMVNNTDLEWTLRDALGKAIQKGFRICAEGGNVGMRISYPGQDLTKKALLVPFCKKEQLTVDKIFNQLQNVLQSNEQFLLDDELTVEIAAVNNP
jgi:hypothetical protein